MAQHRTQQHKGGSLDAVGSTIGRLGIATDARCRIESNGSSADLGQAGREAWWNIGVGGRLAACVMPTDRNCAAYAAIDWPIDFCVAEGRDATLALQMKKAVRRKRKKKGGSQDPPFSFM
ncbi:hypothetical protein LPN01_10435 [Sphingomonas sp. A2-49]|uniref:hypothetical protein n=1 Tax=Sphingomonas sp. A2-49 TaxID=1391375 RepID=UPI0021D269B3|nr:hypothetical protein [Sphingomonas sp. A2-49]MCU6454493.1 hypothetical protein [Sphingomonas sp. A2-49]